MPKAPSEGGTNPEGIKTGCTADIKLLKERFPDDSYEYGSLDDLAVAIERDEVGTKSFRFTINDVRLNIGARDDADTAYKKIRAFLDVLKQKMGVETSPAAATGESVERGARAVKGAVKGVTEALVPEKGHTEWRDINAEITNIANAFKGTETERVMRDLREKSHNKEIGKENLRITVEDVVLNIKKGDKNATIVAKLGAFVAAIKANNDDKFETVTAPAEQHEEGEETIFWRDVIAGIDGLVKAYPDGDYKSLVGLRHMLENGEVGQGMHLLLTIGTVHLWVKKTDDNKTIKDKIAIFIGELKQIASQNKKGKEKPLDPALDKTYWRDIEAGLLALEPAFGGDAQFKLLKMSVNKGILGTVKNFHATIGGVELDIKQSDTDTQMKDKLSVFLRELNRGSTIKLNEDARKRCRELEDKYKEMERKNLDLDSRYRQATGDLRQTSGEIVRLEDQVRRLQAEVRRLQTAPPPAPTRTTTRSWGG